MKIYGLIRYENIHFCSSNGKAATTVKFPDEKEMQLRALLTISLFISDKGFFTKDCLNGMSITARKSSGN